MTGDRSAGSFALRVAVAFIAVAVFAVGILSALIVFVADSETTELVERQHREDTRAVAAATAAAYREAGSWPGADLRSAGAVAARASARLIVTDRNAVLVAAPTDELAEMMAAMHGAAAVDEPRGHPVTEAVIVDGKEVGGVTLAFPLAASPAEQVRDSLWRTVVVGAALASAAAVMAAVIVARRVTQPVVALTDAATRQAAGDRSARASVGGPGELGALARAFDDMAEQLETEDRLRRRMVTDVAHELRTPLTILRGEIEALVDGVTTPDAAALTSLHEEVRRLSRLVADLETLAAADAARLSLHHDPVDLGDVADAAVATMRTSAEDKVLHLEVDPEPAPVAGDADRLHQIALNLLTNAVKFTPSGGTISVISGASAGRAWLEVSDTGTGMTPDEVAHAFDRFWQGAQGKAAGGSGIGLAVAAELAAAHGGTLTVRPPRSGSGACFRLELPAR